MCDVMTRTQPSNTIRIPLVGGVAASLKSTGAPALDEMPAFDIEELKSGK